MTADENSESDLLFGDQKAAAFATEEYGVPVSADMITYWWRTAKKIRPPYKFGHNNVRKKSELREDLRGKIVP